jgi:predicted nucleic acid-binding protein
MPRPRVYVETTIPSAYFDQGRDPLRVAKRRWTRVWWDVALDRYEVVTSAVTMKELEDGPAHRHAEWLGLLRNVKKLEVTESADAAAGEYVRQRLMPRRGDDSFHLAVASVHKCAYLVTWDVQHLANAHKFLQIRRVNVQLGLHVPTIATPLQMLGRMP